MNRFFNVYSEVIFFRKEFKETNDIGLVIKETIVFRKLPSVHVLHKIFNCVDVDEEVVIDVLILQQNLYQNNFVFSFHQFSQEYKECELVL
jgi:hypothetical protein